MKAICFLVLFSFLNFISFCQTDFRWAKGLIKLEKGLSFNLKIPEGYDIRVAAEGLNRPRFFAKSPDGRLFITDMYNRGDNKRGKILILENWSNEKKRFFKITTFLDKLHNPNSIAFYSINNKNFIYIAETGKLSFYEYKAGDSVANGVPVVIASFPDYGLSYKYGGWHLTRSIAFHNNIIYVSVGSSCDACIENEEVRATILEMDPHGSNKKTFARGIRNAVGIKWVKDQLWVTHMGRDNRGPDKPEELFHTVNREGFYGWPYYYQFGKTIIADTQFTKSKKPDYVKKPAIAPYAFKAHSAPLGFEFFYEFKDSVLNNTFLVALHGSTSVWRQRGNAVVQVLKNGAYREIVTGFLQGTTENKRMGRPCDIVQWNDHSFFISDDKNGVIYYVEKQ